MAAHGANPVAVATGFFTPGTRCAAADFQRPVKGGQFDGERVMRSTAPQLSKQSKLAEVIEGILGRDLTDKELQGGFDLEELIDKECSILVLQSKSKTGAVYSNVERVFST
jgi:hypothetical protein